MPIGKAWSSASDTARMFLDPANFRHPAFRTGMADAFKVAPGIWAWGLMTGVSMVQAGLGPAMST